MFRSLNSAGLFPKNAVGKPPPRNTALTASSAFLALDFRECAEDFLALVAGTYSLIQPWTDLNGNTIWPGPFMFFLEDYTWCDDDFLSYSAGTYATLSGGNGWLTDWSFFGPT